MSGNQKQRATAAVLSVLLAVIIALIVWEVSYFTRRRSSAATAPPAAHPDSPAAVASAAPPPSLPPRLRPVTVVPHRVSDPFKPALNAETPPPPSAGKVTEKVERPKLTDSVALPMSVPPLLPLSRSNEQIGAGPMTPEPAPQEPGLRLTGIITDASSSVAIVEGKGEEYRLRAGDFLPDHTRIIAVSSRGIVMRRDKSVYQINVGEVLPWKD
jgi:hypothetical protein